MILRGYDFGLRPDSQMLKKRPYLVSPFFQTSLRIEYTKPERVLGDFGKVIGKDSVTECGPMGKVCFLP